MTSPYPTIEDWLVLQAKLKEDLDRGKLRARLRSENGDARPIKDVVDRRAADFIILT